MSDVYADQFFVNEFWSDLFWSSGTDLGVSITNANATVAPTNQEVCDRSGFYVYPGELVKNWDGVYTRKQSVDQRHPQLLIRSVSEEFKGSVSPESEDSFVGVNEVQADDL